MLFKLCQSHERKVEHNAVVVPGHSETTGCCPADLSVCVLLIILQPDKLQTLIHFLSERGKIVKEDSKSCLSTVRETTNVSMFISLYAQLIDRSLHTPASRYAPEEIH